MSVMEAIKSLTNVPDTQLAITALNMELMDVSKVEREREKERGRGREREIKRLLCLAAVW